MEDMHLRVGKVVVRVGDVAKNILLAGNRWVGDRLGECVGKVGVNYLLNFPHTRFS